MTWNGTTRAAPRGLVVVAFPRKHHFPVGPSRQCTVKRPPAFRTRQQGTFVRGVPSLMREVLRHCYGRAGVT